MTPETLAYINYGACALFAAMTLFGVVLPILGKTRIKHEQSGAKSTFFGVKMLWAARVKQTKQVYEAVLAQEVCEFWLRWFVSLAVGFAVFVTTASPFSIIAVFAVGLFLDTILYKQVDLIGRAVEVTVADQDFYLKAEAERLINGTRGNFKNNTVDEVKRMIEARFGIARVLAGLLRKNWA